MNLAILQQAANEARGLAIDAIHAAGIGHLGLPLGAAEIGAVLFSEALRFNPEHPEWINRDRFVLSAGHGSMFQYAWLHIAGYDLPMAEIKRFRQLHSKTPGHPEFRETAGVECTTGPLGQGIGNAVGMAMAAKMAAAQFNTARHTILDHRVVCLAGDGCLQEGVAAEASSLAAHWGLDNLIVVFDSNEVTLDAPLSAAQSEDLPARYRAYGWDVVLVDGHDMQAVATALCEARANLNGRPKLIVARTTIGRGIPEVAGTSKAHGEGGAKFAAAARRGLGLPDESWYVSADTKAYFGERKLAKASAYASWCRVYAEWAKENPDRAALLESGLRQEVPANLLDCIAVEPAGTKAATRVSGGKALNAVSKVFPFLVSGSADLHSSTKNYIDGVGDFSRANYAGRNIRYGVREHAMGAIINGFGYHGLYRASGATFLSFADYMRPSIRMAALTKIPVCFIFTHDSVGVGEDGPTHQPVEHVASLRLIPGLDVIRPADCEETAAAVAASVANTRGPTVLILSRQDLPAIDAAPAAVRREGTLKGGYVLRPETGPLKAIVIATGSEVAHAVAAAEKAGSGVRVVSLPSFKRFEEQTQAYRDSVLPPSVTKRVVIEAGVSYGWHKYAGPEGVLLTIDRFGMSAPGPVVMKELGMTPDSVLAALKGILG